VAQRVGRVIAVLFHDRGTRREWVVSSTLRPHFTPGKDPVPILQEAGWARGPVWTGGKSRPHRNSIPDHQARNSVAIPTELPGPIVRILQILITQLLLWQTLLLDYRIPSFYLFRGKWCVRLYKILVRLEYSRVSFCDGSFNDDSLLRPLSSRTEHSRLAVHQCRNSSVLSVLSALLALFVCACVSAFAILVKLFSVDCDFFHPWRTSERQKRRKNQNSWRYILSWCLLNHRLGPSSAK